MPNDNTEYNTLSDNGVNIRTNILSLKNKIQYGIIIAKKITVSIYAKDMYR